MLDGLRLRQESEFLFFFFRYNGYDDSTNQELYIEIITGWLTGWLAVYSDLGLQVYFVDRWWVVFM